MGLAMYAQDTLRCEGESTAWGKTRVCDCIRGESVRATGFTDALMGSHPVATASSLTAAMKIAKCALELEDRTFVLVESILGIKQRLLDVLGTSCDPLRTRNVDRGEVSHKFQRGHL